MTDGFSQTNTRHSKWIKAPPEVLYRAFTDPSILAVWQASGDMTGSVHRFDVKVGAGYQMSLDSLSSETTSRGKKRKKNLTRKKPQMNRQNLWKTQKSYRGWTS